MRISLAHRVDHVHADDMRRSCAAAIEAYNCCSSCIGWRVRRSWNRGPGRKHTSSDSGRSAPYGVRRAMREAGSSRSELRCDDAMGELKLRAGTAAAVVPPPLQVVRP